MFITGTDTGVGKTFVTACLARLLREEGGSVSVSKPVATGARRSGDRWLSDDAVRNSLRGELEALRGQVAEPGACGRAAEYVLNTLASCAAKRRAA